MGPFAGVGFRSMKVVDPAATSELALRAPVPFFFRDFSRERPVSDDVFRAYSALYSYDHTDLGALGRSSDDSARDWRHEIVEFSAAYGGERMTAHVFLPKRAAPPFQTLNVLSGHQRAAPALQR